MSGSSSTISDFFCNRYRWGSRWNSALLKIASIGLLFLVCGFYVAPEVATIQTTFYLTLLLPAMLLVISRRDWSFVYSWQLFSFCLLPLLLATSSLWALEVHADIQRDFPYYLKIALYLILFYCALYMVMERYGDTVLQRWLQWLIPVGLISCGLSLVSYIHSGGLDHLRRIGGISLDGDIDKTGLLYGFFAFFCCYGLSLGKYWRWLSLAGLFLACAYALVSQTKIPLAMVGVAIVIAAISSRRVSWKTAALLLGVLSTLPVAYLLLFGELPFMHRSNAYSVRIELWRQAFDQFLQSPLVGSGLMYKRYIELNSVLPHPHNYLIDIARFSGILGVAAAAIQLLTAAWVIRKPKYWLNWLCGVFIVWFAFGTLAMLIYAQQPLVKPSYIWFLYWIPLAVILVRSQLKNEASSANELTDNLLISESQG